MIFITGGTGLVGSHLLLSLLQQGERVRAVKRKSSHITGVRETFSWYSENADHLFSQIEWVEGDLADLEDVERMLEGVDTVYHCAAMVAFDRKSQNQIISNNVHITANLVDAALQKGIKKFCHVSSVSALGKAPDNEPVTEETSWVPSGKLTAYSRSKFFSEMEVWRGVEEGLNAVVVNPSIIVGPGNWKSGSPAFFRFISRGMKFYTKGGTGFVDVRDVAEAMVFLMKDENFGKALNQRFILNAANLSYRKFFSAVATVLEVPAPSIPVSRAMLSLAAAGSWIISIMTGKPAQINSQTLASASSVSSFDGTRISSKLGFTYRPVQEAIEHTGRIFRMSGMKNK